MRCPKCACLDDKVVDSRAVKEGAGVRRRRECLSCGYRYTTIEGIIPEELKVVKRTGDGRNSTATNCAAASRTPATSARSLRTMSTRPSRRSPPRCCGISTKRSPAAKSAAGSWERLRGTDQVAYVRFASVYRKFQDVDEFIEEIRQLK